jgi:hypothetical protein
MFDGVLLAGVSVAALILGIVEAAKKFGVTGNGSFALALVLGVALFGLSKAIELGLIPPEALPWIEVAVFGLGGSLAVTGLYDLAKKWFSE